MVDYAQIYSDFMRGKLSGFYDNMYPGLLRHTARMLGDELSWLAEDCLQDIILAAYENRKSLKDADQWRAWILASIRNRVIDLTRKAQSAKNYVEKSYPYEIHNAVEADLIEQETMNAFFEAVRSLPEKYREIVELSFVRGLRNAEVAELLNITEIAVRKRKIRLIEILRSKLGDSLDGTTIILLLGNKVISQIIDVSAY